MNRFISLISLWLAIFILSACNAQYSPSLANDLAVNSLHLGDIEHLSGNLEKAIESQTRTLSRLYTPSRSA